MKRVFKCQHTTSSGTFIRFIRQRANNLSHTQQLASFETLSTLKYSPSGNFSAPPLSDIPATPSVKHALRNACAEQPIGSKVRRLAHLHKNRLKQSAEMAALDHGHTYARRSEDPQMQHGVSLENRAFIASVEAAHQRDSHLNDGGWKRVLLKDNKTSSDKSRNSTRVVRVPLNTQAISFQNSRYSEGHHEYISSKWTDVSSSPREVKPQRMLSQRMENCIIDLFMCPMPTEEKRQKLVQLSTCAISKDILLSQETVETVMGILATVTKKDRVKALKRQTKLISAGVRSSAGQDKSLTGETRVYYFNPYLTQISSLYFFLRRFFSVPTPRCAEIFLEVLSNNAFALTGLSHALPSVACSDLLSPSVGSALLPSSALQTYNKRGKTLIDTHGVGMSLLNLAHRIMLDSYEYQFLPTRRSCAMYFDLCAHYGEMRIAVRRYVDLVDNYRIMPTATMLTSLIRGLVANGYTQEATEFVERFEEVPMTTSLLNACLEAFLLSDSPQSCFSAYSAVLADPERRVRPDTETYTLLLLACERMDDWSRTTEILLQVQQNKIRTDSGCINLLLKGLLQTKKYEYAAQMAHIMRAKAVPLWPALKQALIQKGLLEETACFNNSTKFDSEESRKHDEKGDSNELGLTQMTHSGDKDNAKVPQQNNNIIRNSKDECTLSEEKRIIGVIPNSVSHLKTLIRRNRFDKINPDSLLAFLRSRGVELSQEQLSNVNVLRRKTIRELFGVKV